MLNLLEGLRPAPSRQVIQQLGAPCCHVIASYLANHTTDESAVEQKIIAASSEAMERIRHWDLERSA